MAGSDERETAAGVADTCSLMTAPVLRQPGRARGGAPARRLGGSCRLPGRCRAVRADRAVPGRWITGKRSKFWCHRDCRLDRQAHLLIIALK